MHYITIDNTLGFYEAINSDKFNYPLNAVTIGEISESDKLKLFLGSASYEDREMKTVGCSVYHGGCRIGAMQWVQPIGSESQTDTIFYSLSPKKEKWQARDLSVPKNIAIHSYRDYQWNDRPHEYRIAYFPTFNTLAGLMDYTRTHFSAQENKHDK